MERELTAPVEIAHPDGRLNREAVGWSRHPLHRCNLGRELSRVARWSYWCITSRSGALTILVADVGFAGAVLLSFLEFAGRGPVERLYLRPRGFTMPDSPRGELALEASRLRLELRDRGEELRITADARTLLGRRIAVDLTVARPLAHETINVLVPWDETRFHFTSKQQALPARGVVRVDGREHRFAPENQGFACLDFGRGRWPDGIEWNWAFASATQGARTVGLNLGGTWTDGTGVSESGFVLDGRVHKIAEPVRFDFDRKSFFAPWRLRSARVDLRFDPIRERRVKVPILVELHQMIGSFSGTLVDDSGTPLAIDDMLGVAEWLRARW